MALVFISENAVPTYTAVSSDIVESKITGAVLVGKTVYITDSKDWYIIQKDLTLTDYNLPISISGEITIGEVAQGAAGIEKWLTDGSGVTQPVEGTGTAGTPSANIVTVQGITNGTPVQVFGATGIVDGANLDAFSRLRISSPKTIFNSTFRYDLQPLIFERATVTGGTITHNANLVSAEMTVDTANAASCVIQSRQYHRYIPAKSQLIAITQVLAAAVANVRKRVGYFDSANGIFLEQNGTTDVAIVRRTSTSGSPFDNRVVQADWNIDKLDGNGASGITLNLAKASIMIIDLQWLGMGRVRVGFDIDGCIVYCHQFLNANNLTLPYMQTGTLPIRWEITNTAGSAGATMFATCAAVLSEGGDEIAEGFSFSVSNNADITAGATRTGLLAIRPKTTFNSIVNRIEIAIGEYSAIAGNNPILVELYYNPSTLTVTGGWTDVDATNSCMEYHRVITAVSGGIIIGSFFVASGAANRGAISSSFKGRLPITIDISGANPIPIVVCATATTSTSASRARIDWRELR